MNKDGIVEYKLNLFEKLRKIFFLRRLSLDRVDAYDKLPDKLKYDKEIISAVIAIDKRKINNIPESYLSSILADNPELLRYVDGQNLEEILIDHYDDTIDDMIYFGDTEYLQEIIAKNFPSMEYKIRALRIVANELNRQENEYMDEMFQVDEYDNYIETETRSQMFHTLFMNIYSQLPEDDMKSRMEMINIWRSVDEWKNNLEYVGYEWRNVKDDFYNIIKNTAGNDINKRMQLLQLYIDDFDGDQIVTYLEQLGDNIDLNSNTIEIINRFKSSIIEDTLAKLVESGNVLWAVSSIEDKAMQLKLLKSYCDLYTEDVERETKSLMTSIFYDTFSELEDYDKELKIQMLEEYWDYIFEDYDPADGDIAKAKESPMFYKKNEVSLLISSYAKDDEQNKKVELLRKFSDRLNGINIASIIESFYYVEYDDQNDEYEYESNDSLKVELLKEFEQKLTGQDISSIISSIDNYSIQLQLLKEYENRLNKVDIARIISNLNCEGSEKIKIVEQYKHILADKQKYHDAYTDRSFDFSELLVKITIRMTDDEKRDVINKYQSEMNQNDIMHVIISVHDESTRQQLFNENGFGDLYNYDLAVRCFQNFGITPFNISSNMGIMSNDFVEIVGVDLAYSFVKYILDGESDKIIPIDKIIKEPQLFKQFIDFREKSMQHGKQKTLELDKFMEEYGRCQGLFAEFSMMENDDVQNSIMQAIITDGIHNSVEGMIFDNNGELLQVRRELINDASEIMQYPIKRKEYFEQKINSNSIDTEYEIILGINREEYVNLKSKFIGLDNTEASLSKIFEEIMSKMPAENRGNIANMIAGIKLIEKYENTMDEEVRKKFLLACNDELSQQFEGLGSKISKIRESASFVEEDLRRYFGKELSESLYFPLDVEETERVSGVQVIHMKGEDFQCLIHAVDAYGSGSGHYEKRETGNSYLCTSLISSKFMGRADGKPIVAFSTMPSQSFIQEGPTDVGVRQMMGKNHFNYRASGIRYMPSQELLEETVFNNAKHGVKYDEVDWYREYYNEDGSIGYLIPDAILCFNEIDEASIEEAKHIQEIFGLDKPLPIRVIHEEYYREKIEEFKRQVIAKYEQREEAKDETLSKKVEKMLEEMLQYASPEVTNSVLQAIIEAEKANAQER